MFIMIANPYAGITRVRFKGYNLSRVSVLFQNVIGQKRTVSGTPDDNLL
jgi:hypothetical protein